MKRYLFLIFFVVNYNSFSQNLSLNELFSLCNKSNWDGVNEFLLKDGWDYYESEKGENDGYSTITWSYNKDSYSDKAEAWFYIYTYEDKPNKLVYTFFNKSSYNSIKSGIATAGMKLIDNSIEDNELTTKYSGSSFILLIRTTKREISENYSDENSITSYSVVVIKKAGIYDSDNGSKSEYYDNGQVKIQYYLTDGKLNGYVKFYYETGILQKEGKYLNGKENGKFTEYNESGGKVAEYTMINGLENGVTIIYQDGLISQEITKKDGIKNGKFVDYYYDDNDNLNYKIVGNYSNDLKDGIWQTFINSEGKEELLEFSTYSADIKNGAFKKYVNSDTLETGIYKNGILDGYYTRKTKLVAYDGENYEEEMTFWNIDCEGLYKNGLKKGKWVNYFLGNKIYEGIYENGEKTGKWIMYVVIGNHIGEIYSEANYYKDKENGSYKRFFEFEQIEDSVDNKHSIRYINRPIQESYNFRNGIRDGEYLLNDSSGVLICKGFYSNGEKNGTWIESYITEGMDGNNYYIYEKGNYTKNEKDGIWDKYVDENNILAKYNFSNGSLNGKTILFKANKPYEERYFNNDRLKSLNIYDSLGINIIRTYEILTESPSEIKCRKIDFNEYGKTSQEYILKFEPNESMDYEFFQLIFLLKTGKLSDGLNGYPDGEYKVYDKSNNVLIEGVMYKNEKTGKWKYYYHDIKIFCVTEYKNNLAGIEEYYTIPTSQPFSGKFIQKYDNGKLKFEFEISKGLRNGKSKYFDISGKLIRTEKFSKGTIK